MQELKIKIQVSEKLLHSEVNLIIQFISILHDREMNWKIRDERENTL